ncbi:MAG: efflux RND transporter periplasmic adaptor subunit [Polyangiaceae bacterium]|nr:efflux RND transporter periplasmic adaptor subunit [Polyangiaceae bacterium]
MSSVPEAEPPPAEPATAEPHHDVPGTRLMAIVRWTILVAMALLAAGIWWRLGPGAATAQGPDRYYCPMHPEIRSPNPGTCPICFMQLEPIPASGAIGSATMPAASASVAPPREPGAMPTAPVMLTLARRQSVGITTTKAEKKSISRSLRLPAVIEAPKSAVSEVHVRSPGFVEQVAPIETGDQVKAGQPLAWVFAPEIMRTQQELLAARALSGADGAGGVHDEDRMVDAARTRLELLGVGRGISSHVLEQGKAMRAVPVSAPRSGVVTARNVSLGAHVVPESALFQVTDLSTLWISATAAPEDLPILVPKMRGRFAPRIGQSVEVELLLVEPVVGAQTRTLTARFLAKNADSMLLPGGIGDVSVSLPPEDRLLVPRDAVIDTGAQRYVFVETSPGLYSPRAVEAGPTIGDERVIEHGLEPGDVVVGRGVFLLDSESRLQGALSPAPAGSP